jgi:flagellar basal-body rod modification protein FlgD
VIDAVISHPAETNAAAQKTTSATGGGIGLDKDAFMKLLVAQLRYQDPMNPANGQEYLAQAAQFAAVERLEEIAQAQSETVAYQQILLSSSLVGRQVKATDGDDLVSGVVSGVKFDNGSPVLVVGDKEIPVGTVEEVTTATPI